MFPRAGSGRPDRHSLGRRSPPDSESHPLMPILIRPAAAAEIGEAFLWYERRYSGETAPLLAGEARAGPAFHSMAVPETNSSPSWNLTRRPCQPRI